MKHQLLISLFVLGCILITCQSSENKNPIGNVPTPPDLDICDVNAKYYEIHNSITLPQVQDIPGHKDPKKLIAFLQNAADDYSWKNFIAMNWPAKDGGVPDTSVCFGEKDDLTVWEYWAPDAHIYRPDGRKPLSWESEADSVIKPRHYHKYEFFRFNGKDPDYSILNAEDAPVVDQDSNFTLYQISYNKLAYDYVVNTGLYSRKGQQKFVKNWPNKTTGLVTTIGGDTMNVAETFERAYFPIGNVTDSIIKGGGDTVYHFTVNPVSIIAKSAWKQLSALDDSSQYHVRETVNPSGDTMVLGLVGLHFIQKVAESTQWIWSTFEHINNAPNVDKHGDVMLKKGVDYIYFNEADTNKNKFNLRNSISLETKQFGRYPTQVVREDRIENSAKKMNIKYHDMIRKVNENSVWLNYELIGTQWPFDPALFTFGGAYQPEILANSVMETYKQITSSCMDCHKNARFKPDPKGGQSYFADFVFSVARAK